MEVVWMVWNTGEIAALFIANGRHAFAEKIRKKCISTQTRLSII